MRQVYTSIMGVKHVKDTFTLNTPKELKRAEKILEAIRSDIMGEDGSRGSSWTTFTTPANIDVTIFDRGMIIVRDILYRGGKGYRDMTITFGKYGEITEIEFDRGF